MIAMIRGIHNVCVVQFPQWLQFIINPLHGHIDTLECLQTLRHQDICESLVNWLHGFSDPKDPLLVGIGRMIIARSAASKGKSFNWTLNNFKFYSNICEIKNLRLKFKETKTRLKTKIITFLKIENLLSKIKKVFTDFFQFYILKNFIFFKFVLISYSTDKIHFNFINIYKF